jgi:hypothetical protein
MTDASKKMIEDVVRELTSLLFLNQDKTKYCEVTKLFKNEDGTSVEIGVSLRRNI